MTCRFARILVLIDRDTGNKWCLGCLVGLKKRKNFRLFWAIERKWIRGFPLSSLPVTKFTINLKKSRRTASDASAPDVSTELFNAAPTFYWKKIGLVLNDGNTSVLFPILNMFTTETSFEWAKWYYSSLNQKLDAVVVLHGCVLAMLSYNRKCFLPRFKVRAEHFRDKV